MPRTDAGSSGGARKRWGWGGLMAGAFAAGLLLVGIALLRAPEPDRPRADNLPTSPVPGPPAVAALDNAAPRTPSGNPSPRLAIIVDDLGYDPVRDAEWLKFPERITVSVLPFGPSSKSIAASARARNYGVILHVPMEPEGSVTDRTEPFLLRRGMSPEEIAERFARMTAEVPGADGASNHMGSAFTSDPEAMAAFSRALKGKGYFFIDSVTSAGTVGLAAAEKVGVPARRRDVVLDDDARPEEIRRQWDLALRTAKERGEAVLLCHCRRETLRLVLEMLPQLRKEGIRAVTVQDLFTVR